VASFLIGGHVAAVSTHLVEFEQGHKWLWGGGLGVGMFCLWLYGLLLFREENEEALLLSKGQRIGMRLVVSLLLVTLPLAETSIVQFMVTGMALFVCVTLWEMVGGLLRGVRIFESWEGRHPPADENGTNEEDRERRPLLQ
jgi:hypothetical protein